MGKPSKADAAWAAGLFEGEGSIQIWKLKSRHDDGTCTMQVRLWLSMTDKDVVYRFWSVVDAGNLGEWFPGGTHHPHWKLQYRWSCGKRTEVRRILNMLLPYLGERRTAKALEALAL